MAHHGNNPFEGLDSFNGDEFKKSMPAPQRERIDDLMKHMEQKVGPTGQFPDGKMNESDDGEISIGITAIENRVIMNFGNPVKWIGFTRDQAKQIAASLLKYAE